LLPAALPSVLLPPPLCCRRCHHCHRQTATTSTNALKQSCSRRHAAAVLPAVLP
jgi:hypothetical protein